MDGATNAGSQEDELVVLVHCFKIEAIKEIKAHTCDIFLHCPQWVNASGLMLCIHELLKLLDFEVSLMRTVCWEWKESQYLLGLAQVEPQ